MDVAPRSLASELDVAIVHEWLTNRAGSERCVEALVDAFPVATLYTPLIARSLFLNLAPKVRTARVQSKFGHSNGHLRAGPLLPFAMRSLQVEDHHDLVLLSFHHFATWARIPPAMPSIVYCYTPPRFIYRTRTMDRDRGAVMRLASAVRPLARWFDQRYARRPGRAFVAISSTVADRMLAAYGVEAQVVHPPVDIDRWKRELRNDAESDVYLLVGRLVPYKRHDIAIEAFRGLRSRLVVVGEGRERDRLEAAAPANVSFVGHVSDDELARLYGQAQALIFPSDEDFGLVPAEAMAAGCPVVALRAGGVADYLMEGTNGVFFDEPNPQSIRRGLDDLRAMNLDRRVVSSSVAWLGSDRFMTAMRALARSVTSTGPAQATQVGTAGGSA